MLRWRLALGVLFVALLVGLFWADWYAAREYGFVRGRLIQPLAFVVMFLATSEFCGLVRRRVPELSRFVLTVGNAVVLASAFEPSLPFQSAVFVGAVLGLLLNEMLRYDKDRSQQVTERLGVGVFGLVYVGLFMGYLVRLWLLPVGPVALASMLAVVKLGDIGAYTVGRLFGQHKLCPKLSPGKTIEGLGGAVLFSCLGALVIGHLWGPPLAAGVGPGRWLAYGALLSVVGALGDLAESMLKRDFGAKDSSTWMPGFGGVLDLVDSPLVAAPVAWMLWESGWLGTP